MPSRNLTLRPSLFDELPFVPATADLVASAANIPLIGGSDKPNAKQRALSSRRVSKCFLFDSSITNTAFPSRYRTWLCHAQHGETMWHCFSRHGTAAGGGPARPPDASRCQQRHSGMTHRPNNSPAPVAGHRRVPPVRVKVWRADGKLAKVHPPDGEAENWWRRLNNALGTMSSDFVNASLFQIQAAARSPLGGISELSMNAALAMVEAAAPRDEAALAVQMACTHTAAMAVLAKLDVAFATERRVAAFGSAAARLLRAYAMQVEVLRRLRNGGQQFVRVEHVHLNDGGQAVIGNVKKQDVQD